MSATALLGGRGTILGSPACFCMQESVVGFRLALRLAFRAGRAVFHVLTSSRKRFQLLFSSQESIISIKYKRKGRSGTLVTINPRWHIRAIAFPVEWQLSNLLVVNNTDDDEENMHRVAKSRATSEHPAKLPNSWEGNA